MAMCILIVHGMIVLPGAFGERYRDCGVWYGQAATTAAAAVWMSRSTSVWHAWMASCFFAAFRQESAWVRRCVIQCRSSS
jgi:hypothetical protein